MDNSNNTNWPNDPNPTPPTSGSPIPDLAPTPGTTTPLSSNSPWSTPTQPLSSPTFPTPSMPSYTDPAQTQSFTSPANQNNTPTQAAITTEQPNSPTPPSMNTSPLDNPWGAPSQPPVIDGPTTPQPTWMPNSSETIASNATINPPISPQPAQTETPLPVDNAPTDLSHLLGNNALATNEPVSQPLAETLVVPPNASPEVPNLPMEPRKGIPKWLIGVGISLLIVIAAASAYFILGIGQPSKQTTSIPAEVAQQTIKTAPPINPPASTPPENQPTATGSASFGELQEGNQPQQATSAAELLRQRQQGR
ncbi:hypothetical protein A3H40_04360 [Candidatus Daviesbacteria bacterium RIFCSPLOWO2_02_FULL_38_15]|uniref:Uncharacterized protein n=1 Tax=Candidatus Daviesbacteria bacterium RIFCSPLOWO2_02_FULL_38_15 TaxID=1797794 RepID=A0A1F5N4R9_9BACT|nr:MAG: hypothetical protein A3H40_04360 [Candidatus Daviesbacteria bacterium RIFCSPLOWO2_02_FULL_38_15]